MADASLDSVRAAHAAVEPPSQHSVHDMSELVSLVRKASTAPQDVGASVSLN
jgi:hypothetical protein